MSLWVPEGAAIPSGLQAPGFTLRPLRASDAAIDHVAYVASPDVIRAHSGGRWPTAGFTVADNEPLAAQHAADHLARRAFTFLVLSPDESASMGCLYLLPLRPFLQRAHAPAALVDGLPAGAAMVTFWVRQDLQDGDLPDRLVGAVDRWLREAWPFPAHHFRVNDAEPRSALALGRAGLRPHCTVSVDGPPHRYTLFGPGGRDG